MSIKRAFFWVHLATGLLAGGFIGLMAFTGACIAYGPQLIETAQRDVTRVRISDTPRLSVETLLKNAGEKIPGFSPAGVFVYADPERAVMMAGGRGKPAYYADPYTGEIREQGAPKTRAFITFMTGLHRWLALPGGEPGVTGTPRDVGRIVTGTSACGFALLALTGLVIWWPRRLKARVVRPAVWFMRGATGKVRDWNWHNVFGFWGLPVFATLAVTGAMIGFPWARALPYYAFGEKPPVRGEGPGDMRPVAGRREKRATGDAPRGEQTDGDRAGIPPDAKPIGYDAALAIVTRDTPDWESVSFRFAQIDGNRHAGPRRNPGDGETPDEPRLRRRHAPGNGPITATVKRSDVSPLFANVAYSIAPDTGAILKKEAFADKSPGEKIGGSIRNIHTGEGFGLFGQTVSLLGALATLVPVYTGFALSWRRFFGKTNRAREETEV